MIDDEYDSLIAEVDNLLYNEEAERMVYEREASRIRDRNRVTSKLHLVAESWCQDDSLSEVRRRESANANGGRRINKTISLWQNIK